MSLQSEQYRQFERLPVEVFDRPADAVATLAGEIAGLIRARADRPVVLGLATGSTPVRLYRELIRLHREEDLSFANVITFNLDEYSGLPARHPESYHRFMREQLFDHIDIPESHIHIPDGTVPRADVFEYCRRYEQAITDAGGIDLQVLGIGRTGHIGFNEPGSPATSRTRLVTLDPLTRRDAARDFRGEANVPSHAITMGIGTILDARRVVLLAWGEAKAPVLARAVEEEPTTSLPASFLQKHNNCAFLVDGAAASELTRFRLPWKVGPLEWSPGRIQQAVVWLSSERSKPVLKLVEEDYTTHYLADLLTGHGPAYTLNIESFNVLQHTITGWPGGKPGVDDSNRPERASPHPKHVAILAPEPGDEIFGMGGTLSRLVTQGHLVRVFFLTSGSLGVPDEEARVGADLLRELAGPDLLATLDAKGPDDEDPPELRRLKGRIRRGEARAALRLCGLEGEAITFLDLPFYEQGRYRQFNPGEADAACLGEALGALQPHQIFLTGQGEDPASVAGACAAVIDQTLARAAREWRASCRCWLYRPPAREWNPAEVGMAVPLSPDELGLKTRAGYQHRSQRSQLPGGEGRGEEEWTLARERNRRLAEAYDQLGLAEYEALEAFRRLELP